ncbi:MAG: hypothetical protein ABFS39_09645 [Pseudomonadota bacterium]
MIEWAGTRITDGADQTDRIVPALQADYFNIDELLFEELLAMTAEFAAQFRFYNLKNEVNGNWAELFTTDEAVIMAMILSTDLKRAESDFMLHTRGSIERLARFVMQWAHKINFWLDKLNNVQHRSGMPLGQKIRALVKEKLSIELHAVSTVIEQLELGEQGDPRIDFSLFGPAWRMSKASQAVTLSSDSDDLLDKCQSEQRLRTAFYAFRHAINYLQTLVPVYLQDSLGSQQHAPATGLLMVFLKLYERAQQRINRFTQRHLDFYYDQVLKAKLNGQLPESVYLIFNSKSGGNGALINKTTEFTAGKDELLKEIVYCADNDLVVTDARIRSLRTLYLQHDNLISPETDLGYVTRIKTSSPQVSKPDEDQKTLYSWPLFGAGRRADGEEEAEIGFAVASSLLLLQEGVRKVELTIFLEDKKVVDADEMISCLVGCTKHTEFMQLIGKFFSLYMLSGQTWLSEENKQLVTAKIEAKLDATSAKEIAKLLSQDWQGLFYKLFKNAFSIKLTADSGWLDITDYIVMPLSKQNHGGDTGLKIIFTLGQEVPPIIPAMGEIHGQYFPTELPLLRCELNPQTNFYPYSLFRDLLIDKLVIDVDVQGVKNILAYNNHGQLDPSKPFQPFGPLPTCNSYFIVGNYEIAKKRLTDLNLNLEWGEFPFTSGGFAEYYRDYDGEYSNNSFKAEFQALVDGEWHVREGETLQPIRLFDSIGIAGAVKKERMLVVDLVDDLKPIDSLLPEAEYGYSLKTRNGFFRLSLNEPSNAFGHSAYPELLTRVLTQNVRLKKPGPAPGQPYTPSINRISLNYRARTEIKPALGGAVDADVQNDVLFHIHPFGIEMLYPGTHDEPIRLLPQYTYQGNLFIGIDALALQGSLSLLFHLAEDLVQEASQRKPEIAWFYLAGNEWRQLPASRVHVDCTDGFLSTGIITLDIPSDITRGNSLMPGDLYWLRVSARKDLQEFCHCYAIQPHAVKLTRVLTDAHSRIVHQPATVKWQAMVSIPGIDGMWQAGKSVAGKAEESKGELIIRLSERLRHKNRALTTWDYEHLILERFPEVAKVKCFSHMTSTCKAPKPGHVLIAVVPHAHRSVEPGCEKLMLSSVQLSRIRTFVQGIAAPFVEIEVRNPVYEQIQVRCTVKFIGGFNSGFYINRLDREISNFICPWLGTGYKARFGWSIRQKDIESHLRELDYVDFVTNFSMLHITQDGERHFSLGDTAGEQNNAKVQIGPKHPWSLAVPARHHFIETMTSARTIKAEVTGIDELEIGHTFIINGNSGYGEKE